MNLPPSGRRPDNDNREVTPLHQVPNSHRHRAADELSQRESGSYSRKRRRILFSRRLQPPSRIATVRNPQASRPAPIGRQANSGTYSAHY